VHVAPTLNPVTVAVKGVASEAAPVAGDGVPLVHVTLIGTLAPLLGTKSLCTARLALFRALDIVQPPVPVGTPLIPPTQLTDDV